MGTGGRALSSSSLSGGPSTDPSSSRVEASMEADPEPMSRARWLLSAAARCRAEREGRDVRVEW